MNAPLLLTVFLLSLAATPARPPAQTRVPTLTYSIAGIVVDSSSGAAVRHAKLYLLNGSDEISVTAEDNGSFRITGLEAGKYQVYASAPGYVRQALDAHGPFFTAVVVGPKLDSEHVVFRIQLQAIIHGRITDERGEPVRNANVMLFSPGASGASAHTVLMQTMAQTNDLGEYRFALLHAGSYFVAVQASPWYAQTSFRYAHSSQENVSFRRAIGPYDSAKPDPTLDAVFPLTFYPGVTDESSASQLHLSPGDSVQADVSLRSAPAVHLRLTNLPAASRDQIPGISAVRKLFGSFAAGIPASTMQISPGEYEVAGLPPQDMTLLINDNLPDHPARALDTSPSDGATLDASRLPPAVTVSGHVVLAPGMAELGENAGLNLMRGDNNNPFIRLKKDGSFSISPVEAGTYVLLVNADGPARFIQKIVVAGAKAKGHSIIIPGGRDVDLTIYLGEGVGKITGFAALEGHSAAGAVVLLYPESGENPNEDSRMDQSDSDGSFTLGGIVPGKYRLLAIQGGWNLDWRDPAVLRPYLEKAQPLQISTNDSRKLTVEVQPLIKTR
jgi:hypothetical protein